MNSKVHIKAFCTHFELACEWGLLILVCDMTWLLRDIIHNGLDWVYGGLFTMFSLCFVGTLWVIKKHHKYYIKRLQKRQLARHIKHKKTTKEKIDESVIVVDLGPSVDATGFSTVLEVRDVNIHDFSHKR